MLVSSASCILMCVCVFGDVSACVSGLVCMYACGGRMLITVTAGQRLC